MSRLGVGVTNASLLFSATVTLVCAIELALFFQEAAVKAKSHGYWWDVTHTDVQVLTSNALQWWRKGLVMSRLSVLPVLILVPTGALDAPITIRRVAMLYPKHYHMVIDQCNSGQLKSSHKTNKQKQQSNKQSSDVIEKELKVVLNQNWDLMLHRTQSVIIALIWVGEKRLKQHVLNYRYWGIPYICNFLTPACKFWHLHCRWCRWQIWGGALGCP